MRLLLKNGFIVASVLFLTTIDDPSVKLHCELLILSDNEKNAATFWFKHRKINPKQESLAAMQKLHEYSN